MYKMQLADGTTIDFEGVNGTNYIVGKEVMDVSVFTDKNLKNVIVTDDEGNQTTFKNLTFIQQQWQLNGDYYVCFREKTEQEIAEAEIEEKLLEIQLALVELYEMSL